MAALPSIVLWIHVICGVTWIGACAGLVIASLGVADESPALASLVLRAAPQVNRIGIACASLIVLTGLGNLGFVAAYRGGSLPEEFVAIVVTKIVLLALMAGALWRAGEELSKIRESAVQRESTDFLVKSHVLLRWYEAVIIAGVAALSLGLWLAGV